MVLYATGYDHLDLALLRDRGIKVSVLPECATVALAERCRAKILALATSVHLAQDRSRGSVPLTVSLRGVELVSRTLDHRRSVRYFAIELVVRSGPARTESAFGVGTRRVVERAGTAPYVGGDRGHRAAESVVLEGMRTNEIDRPAASETSGCERPAFAT